MKATWEDTIIAESDKTVVVEGNHFFPPDSIKREYLSPSDTHTTCPWKGIASYYHVRIGGRFRSRMPLVPSRRSGEIDQRSCRLRAACKSPDD